MHGDDDHNPFDEEGPAPLPAKKTDPDPFAPDNTTPNTDKEDPFQTGPDDYEPEPGSTRDT